jgi:hypothetical protein
MPLNTAYVTVYKSYSGAAEDFMLELAALVAAQKVQRDALDEQTLPQERDAD